MLQVCHSGYRVTCREPQPTCGGICWVEDKFRLARPNDEALLHVLVQGQGRAAFLAEPLAEVGGSTSGTVHSIPAFSLSRFNQPTNPTIIPNPLAARSSPKISKLGSSNPFCNSTTHFLLARVTLTFNLSAP